MSKSLGNFFTVHDLLEQGYPGEVIRFVFLSTHYRKPMDWTEAKAREAEATLRKWRAITDGVEPGEVTAPVLACLADDLNTAGAVAELHKLAASGDTAALKASGLMMGLFGEELADWAKAPSTDWIEELRPLLERRLLAKKAKNFALADKIRDELLEHGISLDDHPDGTTTPSLAARSVFDFLHALDESKKEKIGIRGVEDGAHYYQTDEALKAFANCVSKKVSEALE